MGRRGVLRFRPTNAADPALMQRTDEYQLESTFMGALQLRRQLQRESVQFGLRHIGTLTLRMGIEALPAQPGTAMHSGRECGV